nr:DUF1302 family protein [Pandoraea terrae]
MFAAGGALAGNTIDLGNETSLDWSLTGTYGAAMRTRSPSPTILQPANINGDDGDRNFQKGSLINNRFSLLGEMNLYRGNMGVFLRGSAFYDQVYRRANGNDSPFTVNHSGDFNQFTDPAQFYHGRRAQLLDAYVYNTFSVGETKLNVKLGNQVVAWGESLYFPNIAGAMGVADATKSFVPGAEVKDILLPVPQLSMQWQLNPTVSLMGYYQFTYQPNQLSAPGSYFSTTDVVGPGAQYIIGPGGFKIPRGPDITPSNQGQFGLGSRVRVFGDTEVGLYFLNYHDKNPNVVTSFFPTIQYQQKYFGNIKLYGASASTSLFGANVAGEVSYRDGAPVLVNVGGTPQATRANVWQAQVSAIYSIGPTFLADSQSLVGEIGYQHVASVTPFMGSTQLVNTTNSAAYQVSWSLTYNNVFDGWDLTIPLTYADAFSGHSAVAGSFGSLSGAGDRRVSIGATFKRLNNLELGLTYAKFLGSVSLANRPLADRDYVAFNAKYSF